jgi:DNA-binding NtrC family response regulator
MGKPLIILLAPEADPNRDLERLLGQQGFEVFKPQRVAGLALEEGRPVVVFVDSGGPDHGPALETARQLRQLSRITPIFFIVRHSSEAKAIAAFRVGVTDYLQWPFSHGVLFETIGRHFTCPSNAAQLASEQGEPRFIRLDPRMLALKSYIVRAAALDCNVLT